MVSILIPVYNYDVSDLVLSLNQQIRNIKGAEIIVLDDCSKPDIFNINKQLNKHEKVKVIKNPQNYGRSKTRNILSQKANNECLIFTDGDTLPVKDDFVQRYSDNFTAGAVLFGGIKYRDEKPENPKEYLRWFYGKRREEISVSERQKQGNRLFMTGNFCISKSVFKTVKFDEQITQYGHEDTLFAFDLKNAGINVKHIDNPAYHLGLETGTEFLEKTKIALQNLHHIHKLGTHEDLLNTIRLWKTYQKYHYLKFGFKISYRLFAQFFTKNLTGANPKLLFFDLYKLFALAYTDD